MEFQDNEISNLKNVMPNDDYNVFVNLFKKFLNFPSTTKVFKEQSTFLTEEDIINNFKIVFGYDCPYFAKLLYLYLSNGFDKSKIGMSKFI